MAIESIVDLVIELSSRNQYNQSVDANGINLTVPQIQQAISNPRVIAGFVSILESAATDGALR